MDRCTDQRITSPTVTGSALNRAISVFETLNGIPLRGLIRRDAIGRAGPIRQTEYQDAFEEYVWMAKLAREGNLQHVGGLTYFKRARDNSLHAKFHDKDRLWRRAVWLEFDLGMLETILPLVSEPERQSALAVTVDRLCHPKADRFLFYDGPPIPLRATSCPRHVSAFQVWPWKGRCPKWSRSIHRRTGRQVAASNDRLVQA